jgi:hypothetical protein
MDLKALLGRVYRKGDKLETLENNLGYTEEV